MTRLPFAVRRQLAPGSTTTVVKGDSTTSGPSTRVLVGRALTSRTGIARWPLAASIQELDRLSGAQSVDRQRLAELRAREAALSERQLGVSRADDVTPAELQALEAQNARLREEIEALLGAL